MPRTVLGTCPLDCPDSCSWQVEVGDDGRALALRGNRDHPFTRGALCGKVNRYLDLLHDPARVVHPLRRVGAKGEGRFERISWDEALDETAAGLRRAIDAHGPESVLPYYFAGTEGLIQGWTFGPRVFAALGASRLRTTICTAAASAALRHTVGGDVGPDPEDLEHARLILIWGANTLSTNIHQWRFVLEARRRGAHVVAIDPLRSETAARCDEHLALMPGSDAALALGLMRGVVDRGAADRAWLAAHALGWEALERRLQEWPVERAAELTGLDVAAIDALADRLAATRPTAIRVGLGLQRHGGAGAAVRAIVAIPAVTGDWRHVGGGALCMTGDHFPVDTAAVALPPDMPAPSARAINMSRLGEALCDLDDPPVGALVVFDSNPAASCPDQQRVRRGLEREDLFCAVLEQRLTDTTDYADIVLPATMQPEHADLHTAYGHLYLSWNEPAVEPPGECLPNTEILRRLAARLGLDHPRLRDDDEELARQLLDTPEARAAGVTLERLRERGFMRIGFPRGTAPFAAGGFPTPSGRVELHSPALERKGRDPLVGYVPPHEIADAALARRYPLVLLAPAARFFLNSTFAGLDWHRAKAGPPCVHLSAADAGARGIADGDEVTVRNDRGSFRAQAVVDAALRPGVAATSKVHWAKLSPGGSNVNQTSPERDTDLGGGPTFHDNRVEVEPLRGAAAGEAR